ncbi:MAG: GDSL-type esterase/lipase family protein [bacterium]|nr:GDSL-type esterase/lipase family protein [bacterium]
MHIFWKIILVGSILLNLVAIWGFFHYVRYGGSPLGELKRKLTGSSQQVAPRQSYAELNEQLKKQLAEGTAPDNRVVFFGASITRRWDLESAFPEVNMINRGVGGQLVPGMLSRFKRDVLDLKPEAAIIKFCSINIRPHQTLTMLKDGMTMMVQMAKQGNVKPIVSTIIPAGKPEAHIGNFSVADSLNQFNSWVRSFAEQHNLAMIDFARAIEDEHGFLPRDCSTDPVHVNDKGYQLLAEAARPVIHRALGLE